MQLNDIRYKYSQELLVAVLDRTVKTHGPYELIASIKEGIHATVFMMNKQGYGDVVQGATRTAWERKLIPIRIPILKGMLGLRVIVINKNMQPRFENINSVDELKSLLLGTGKKWSVTKIFDHFNFRLIKIENSYNLYSMLQKNRFDYMTRGISEVMLEYDMYSGNNPNLQIEKSILLNIPLPVYFFVNPQKPKLAQRIEQGLTLLIKDGTLDNIFIKHFEKTINQLNLPARKILHIDNPRLTGDHVIEDPLTLIKLLKTKPTNNALPKT